MDEPVLFTQVYATVKHLHELAPRMSKVHRPTLVRRLLESGLDLLAATTDLRFTRDRGALFAAADRHLDSLRVLVRLCFDLKLLSGKAVRAARRGTVRGGPDARRLAESEMRRVGRLFDRVASFANLLEAFDRAAKGKRDRPGVAAFFRVREEEICRLRRELLDGTWRPGGLRSFTIHDPKEREISVPPFRDRVVHHAVIGVLEPVFEARFDRDSYGCRKDLGIDVALARALRFARRFPFCLKTDVAKFFPSTPNRVNRGGSWNNTAVNARSANRNRNSPANRNTNLGLRPAEYALWPPAGLHGRRPCPPRAQPRVRAARPNPDSTGAGW